LFGAKSKMVKNQNQCRLQARLSNLAPVGNIVRVRGTKGTAGHGTGRRWHPHPMKKCKIWWWVP